MIEYRGIRIEREEDNFLAAYDYWESVSPVDAKRHTERSYLYGVSNGKMDILEKELDRILLKRRKIKDRIMKFCRENKLEYDGEFNKIICGFCEDFTQVKEFRDKWVRMFETYVELDNHHKHKLFYFKEVGFTENNHPFYIDINSPHDMVTLILVVSEMRGERY